MSTPIPYHRSTLGVILGLFRDRRISIKIAIGFLTLIVFLGLMAGFGIAELKSVNASLIRYEAVTENMQRVLRLGRELEVMRQRSLRYKAVHDKQAIAEFHAAHRLSLELLAAAAKATLSDDRRVMYQTASSEVAVAKSQFDEMVKLVDAFMAAQKQLYTTGDQLNAAAGKVARSVEAGGNLAIKVTARDLEVALAGMRVFNWRFQATGDLESAGLFEKSVQNVSKIIDRLAEYDNAVPEADLTTLRAAVKSYQDNFSVVSTSTLKADDIYEHQIRPTLAKAYDIAGKANTSLAADLNASRAAADETTSHGISLALTLGTGAFLVAIVVAWLIGRAISRPLGSLTKAMRELAEGNFEVLLPGLGRKDEIGDIAGAVEGFKIKAAERARLEAEEKAEEDRRAAEAKRSAEERDAAQQRAAEEKAAAERRAAMHKLADGFEQAVGNIIENVSTASTELEAAADTLTKTAETTQQLSTVVASASEEASSNVQSVATATEEMTGSIGEISRQVQESASIAQDAVGQAQKTDARITELSQAANRIGDVVKLITAIAEQTNLLALNATIEAARAGEAGKGFAVVAQEVKALAAQTAKATGEIGAQIASMQSATSDSVTAIKEIGGTIGRIAQIAATIAAAVEEQGAATGEIARNVQAAAKGTAQVATNIVSVNRGAGETGSASSQVLASAQSLASESNHLKAEVQKFLQTVRAA